MYQLLNSATCVLTLIGSLVAGNTHVHVYWWQVKFHALVILCIISAKFIFCIYTVLVTKESSFSQDHLIYSNLSIKATPKSGLNIHCQADPKIVHMHV